MREILEGVYHRTAHHEEIHTDVHSYYIETAEPAILIDPMTSAAGMTWFSNHKLPQHVYLTNRLHYRHCQQFIKAFGTKIWCHEAGLRDFGENEPVQGFALGDELPGGILALEVGVLCPEETALYISHAGGMLAIGDALVRFDGKLGFVPDYLMGSDPEGIKRGLRRVFSQHLQRDFDHLLFAHGQPWIGGAKAGLRAFLKGL